jgi:putative sigma-54 modulation protein
MASESTRSQQDRVVVQVSLNLGGELLRAQRRAANARSAVNATVEALDRQVNRWKSQTYRSERQSRNAPDADTVVEALAAEELPPSDDEVAVEDPTGDLVRIKQFNMEPMSVEEAALQMQYLDHSFYMFLDAEEQPSESGSPIANLGHDLVPFTVSWRDAATCFGNALDIELERLPSRCEVFFVSADLPHQKFSNDKARRLLGWEPQDKLDQFWKKTASPGAPGNG